MSSPVGFVRGHLKGIGIFLVLAVVAGGAAFRLTRGDAAETKEERIIVAPVERRTLQDVVTISGEIGHEETGTLNMLEDGRITSLEVEDGDTVEEGQEILAVDGRPAVAQKGKFPFWRALEEGSIGFDVVQLEQILAAEGFDPGPVDLDFTAQTRAALLAWQAKYAYSTPEPESDETFNISLSSGNGYDVGALNGAAATIQEEPGGVPQQLIDDGKVTPYMPAPAKEVALPSAPSAGKPLVVPAASRRSGPSLRPAAFAATTPQINLAVSPTTVNEGEVARLIFQSSIKAPADITINYSVSGTAQGGPDYDVIGGTALLQAGDRQVEVLVQTFDDETLEPDETVVVDIDTGPDYDVGPDDRASVTIHDETVAEVTVESSMTEVAEGGVVVFTFIADQILLVDTQVDFSVGGDATEEDDFDEVVDDNVVILAGHDRATLEITTVKDSVLEGGESLTVEVSSPPDFLAGSYELGPVVEASVDIVDDFNSLPVLNVTVDDLTIAEGDDGTFTITANVDISDEIEVYYRLGGTAVEGRDYPAAEDSVAVSGGAADDDEDNATADVSVSTDEDGLVEGDETITLTLLPSPDRSYRIGNGSRTIKLTSDDIPKINVAGGGLVYEGGTVVFSVVADQAVAETTSVTYKLAGTAKEGDDYKSTTGVVILYPGARYGSIAVRTIDDDAIFQAGDMVVGEWPRRIGTVDVDLGERIGEGTPIMTLTEDGLTVTVKMSPSERSKLSTGLPATVEMTATDQTAKGKVLSLEDTPDVDESGAQTYPGEIELEDELNEVEGAAVSVDVVVKESKDAIVVPVASLVGSGSDVAVRVVNDDGSLTRTPVKTGLTEGAYIEITEGLKGTERVIIEVTG